MEAYPNPSRDRVTLQVSGLKGAALFQLVELSTGRVVRTVAAAGDGATEVTVGDLPAGVYAAHLLGAAEQVLGTCKVVVIH